MSCTKSKGIGSNRSKPPAQARGLLTSSLCVQAEKDSDPDAGVVTNALPFLTL